MTKTSTPEPLTLRWTWLIRDTVFTERWHKFALLLLAAYADKRNAAKPGLQALADAVGVSKNQMGRFLDGASAAGLLEKDAKKGYKSGTGHLTNAYTLAFPPVAAFDDGRLISMTTEGKRTFVWTFGLPDEPEKYLPGNRLLELAEHREKAGELDPTDAALLALRRAEVMPHE